MDHRKILSKAELQGVEKLNNGELSRHEIVCCELSAEDVKVLFSANSYIDATIAILVTEGEAFVTVNLEPFPLKRDDMLLLSVSHKFCFGEVAPSFRCRYLMVSEQFMSNMDATDMIYRRIKYGARLYASPVQSLADSVAETLAQRLAEVARAISNREHTYYKEVILNTLDGFYLDLSDAIDRLNPHTAEFSMRYGSVARSFVELLAEHCYTEHKVSFYASQLNISEHYLTLILKQVTGRSASDLIYGMIYGHARSLLSTSRLSVQEIAARLHFSDQSAFGKFFRRRSGLSPAAFRSRHNTFPDGF